VSRGERWSEKDDDVMVLLPQAEMQNLIAKLRSLSVGVGYFHWQDDHLQEVPDKLAEQVLHLTANSNAKGSHTSKSQ